MKKKISSKLLVPISFLCFPLITLAVEFGPGYTFEVKKDEKVVAFIVGSLHLLREEDLPLPEAVQKAFDSSGKVFFETDLEARHSEDFQSQTVKDARMPEGKKLSDVLSADTYSLLLSHLEKAGLTEKSVSNYQPWMAAMMTVFIELHQAGYDIRNGVDATLHKKAKHNSRLIGQLEDPAAQIEFLKIVSEDDPDSIVNYSLKTLPESTEIIPSLIKAWKNGDPEPIRDLLIQEIPSDSLYHRILLRDRNKSWLKIILDAINTEKVPPLFVVGAAHLLGEENLLELLAEEGYRISTLR
jgi:uncharacterized protein YbaP (TraB family)